MSAAQIQKLQIQPMMDGTENLIEKQADQVRKHAMLESLQNPVADKLYEISKTMENILTQKTNDVERVLSQYRDQLQVFQGLKGHVLGLKSKELQAMEDAPTTDVQRIEEPPVLHSIPSPSDVFDSTLSNVKKQRKSRLGAALDKLIKSNPSVFHTTNGQLEIKLPEFPVRQLPLQTLFNDLVSSSTPISDVENAALYLRLYNAFPDTFESYSQRRFALGKTKSPSPKTVSEKVNTRQRANTQVAHGAAAMHFKKSKKKQKLD